jgi:starch synthase
LDGLLRRRADDLVGILNGIDTSIWNPLEDENLYSPYSGSHPQKKSLNKEKLRGFLNLESSAKVPLAGCIARLDPQKGFDLLLEIAPRILLEGIQIVILGSGRGEYLHAFRKLQTQFPKRLSVNEGFQEDLAPRIYAGADLFLMPSRYEPCGLGQMIALRYGTLPVVRRTGGLADTIVDVDDDPGRGNGFVFEPYLGSAFLEAVRRAKAYYEDPNAWRKLVKRAMAADFSWESSAKKYLDVYRKAAATRGQP